MTENYCLADISSLAYLDLNVREFHRSRPQTSLLLALDFATKSRNILYGVKVVPNVPLIEIFKPRERRDEVDIEDHALEASFFSNVFRNTLATFVGNWKTEDMKTLLKHIRKYKLFIKSKVYFVYLNANFRRYEQPYYCESLITMNFFQDELMRNLAPELIRTLFERNHQDSCLVAEFFHTVGISWENQLYLFFECKPQITEYILYHLQKAKFHLNDVFITKRESRYRLREIMERNPDNLLVLLNYGLGNRYPFLDDEGLLNIFTSEVLLHRRPLFWESCREVRVLVRTDAKLLKNREIYSLDVILTFLNEFTAASEFESYLKILRFIWRSIPDAYISYEEMRHVPLLLQGTCDKCVEDIIEEFQKHDFENFTAIPQPRSLMHYSRCIIRHALNCNLQLPQGIEHLGLPRRMQSYLKLKF